MAYAYELLRPVSQPLAMSFTSSTPVSPNLATLSLEMFQCPSHLQGQVTKHILQTPIYIIPVICRKWKGGAVASAMLTTFHSTISCHKASSFSARYLTETALVAIVDQILTAADDGEISLSFNRR